MWGRVLRGASFNNNDPDNLLSSNRNNNTPDNRNNNIGFRVVAAVGASSRKALSRRIGEMPDGPPPVRPEPRGCLTALATPR